MNRKQRRAQGQTPPKRPGRAAVAETFAAAMQCHRAGQLAEAERLYRQILAATPLEPNRPEFHNNLGVLLMQLGRLDEAVASFRDAIALDSRQAGAHSNLASALLELERPDEAAACYRTAIVLAPDFAEAHGNLGSILLDQGVTEEAITCFQRALQIAPDRFEIFNNLALAHSAQGDHDAAMAAIIGSLALRETADNRKTFVHCVKHLRLGSEAGVLRPLLLRALREGWDRPSDLARICADVIKQGVGTAPLAALADDGLLQTLLRLTPNLDIELERLLTMARQTLLRTASDPAGPAEAMLDFHAALAQQCFINEYVFHFGDAEFAQAHALRDRLGAALDAGAPVPAIWIAAVAAYFPLSSLASSRRLLETSWPAAIEAILTQQIREPDEERQLRAAIPRLTEVDNPVSRAVQAQYEDNPYPRWVAAEPAGTPEGLTAHLRRKFPRSAMKRATAADGVTDILIAGCGTGRNAVETTQRFEGARTLAVDLSLGSLAHAVRKSRELGVSVEYAQADFLELGSSGRRFDLIEAVGVLHHLADPFAGWHALLQLLRPGGVMMIGLYSETARRHLPDLSGDTAQTADEIRQARQRLIGQEHTEQRDVLLESADFFSISGCRDMLFHVQEQRLTLAAIGAFLRSHDLAFLGFFLDDAVLAAYRRRFADDPGATDLGHWQDFETDNPDTFSGMYQFWVQKA